MLFVLPNFAGGGAERVALTLLAQLDRDSFDPQLAVLDNRGALRPLLADDVVLHDIGKPRLRQALPALISLVRRERPAVVFATQGYLNVALLAARRLMPSGTKLALREASTPSQSLPHHRYPRLMRWAYRRLYPQADLLFCQHGLTAQELVSDFGVAKARIATLPNPIAAASLRETAAPIRRHPGPGLRFVAAGRLSWEKGFDRLIELFAQAPASSHLTIFGEGGEFEALSALVDKFALGQRVLLAGFTDSLPAALAGADALLISSHWEGLPNVALESLACGTPVIATPEAGGIAELAQAAPPGAVTLAPWGDSFRSALESRSEKPGRSLAPSLLPARYELDAVMADFNRYLADLAKS